MLQLHLSRWPKNDGATLRYPWAALFLLLIVFTCSASAALPSIEEFTDGMVKKEGLIPLYYDQDNDNVYLAVDVSASEYLFQSSLPQGVGSNDIGLDRGQLGKTRLIRFERFGNKLLLKQLNTQYRAEHGSVAEKQSIDEAFEKAVTGKLKIEKRMLLNSNLRCEGKATNDHNALNEVVVQKGSGLKIVGLEVYVDNTYMTSYRADGLIIGSPTGSTAYSLSAGGPIIHPSMDALVLSPICPFALTNRPIVVPDRSEIQVRLTSESQKARVTLDGQEEYEMTRNETLTVKKGNNHILLFQSPNKSFYQILREKLQWGGKRDNQN